GGRAPGGPRPPPPVRGRRGPPPRPRRAGFVSRAAPARAARRFEDIAPGTAGYFGWPAAARARTAERAMRLRATLIARAVLADLGPAPRARTRTSPARRSRPRRRTGRA